MAGYFLVFGATKRPLSFGKGNYLDWGHPPVGAYNTDSAEAAFKGALRDSAEFRTFAAIPCVVWGIDEIPAETRQVGRTVPPEERLALMMEKMEENSRMLLQLQSGKESTDGQSSDES
jgi:hypothetical protein